MEQTLPEKSHKGILIGIIIFVIIAIIAVIAGILIYYFFIRKKSEKVNRLSIRQLYTTGIGGSTNISRQLIPIVGSFFFLKSSLDSGVTIDGTYSTSNAMLSPDGNTVFILLADGSLNLATRSSGSGGSDNWEVVWKFDPLASTSSSRGSLVIIEPFIFRLNNDDLRLSGIERQLSVPIVYYVKSLSNPAELETYIEVFNNNTFEIYHLSGDVKTILFDTNSKVDPVI